MKKPKLLHIALGEHNQGLWSSFDKHFEATHYNWIPLKSDPEKLNKEIMKLYRKIKPDVVFMQIQNEGIISMKTARDMTKGSYTINWTGDVRFPLPNWFAELGQEISVSLFSNMHDVRVMNELGINADFLQVGFDPKIFHPFGKKDDTPRVIFMGSNYLNSQSFPLSQLRFDMVRRLKQEYGELFTAYGGGWKELIPEPKFLQVNEEAQAYRTCDIAINLSHFDYGRYSSDRIFRLMGSGAFCLSHQYKEIEKDFIINEQVATWSNIEELIQKINYYLNNPYERELIAMQGCKHVRENCNWDERFLELKNMVI
jgi:spore maturation protein CgeB